MMRPLATRLAAGRTLRLLILCAAAPIGAASTPLVFSEIHAPLDGDEAPTAFIEVANLGSSPLELGGLRLEGSLTAELAAGTLAPGAAAVIVVDAERFRARFGDTPRIVGTASGWLSSHASDLALVDATGATLSTLAPRRATPWPIPPPGASTTIEVVDAATDPSCGAAWRTSGGEATPAAEARWLVPPGSDAWRMRATDAPPAGESGAWHATTYVLDDSWRPARTPVGYGDDDDATLLADMASTHTRVWLRHPFTIADDAALDSALVVRLYADDGAIVWLNGKEIARIAVQTRAHDGELVALEHEACWEEFPLSGWHRALLVPGENVITVLGINAGPRSSDFSLDVALGAPAAAAGGRAGHPSPGELPPELGRAGANSTPLIDLVAHAPLAPSPTDSVLLTARVRAASAVTEVHARRQIVAPGAHVPARVPPDFATILADGGAPTLENPAFSRDESWSRETMRDDGEEGDVEAGDGIYSLRVPAVAHRTLVRYRIEATTASGARAIAPRPADPARNFAYVASAGIPAYVADTRTMAAGGPPFTYPAELIASLPSVWLLARAEDVAACLAFDAEHQLPLSAVTARERLWWEGTLMVDGVVHDHVRFAATDSAGRYPGRGRRSWRFQLPEGRTISWGGAEPGWGDLLLDRLADERGSPTYGLTELVNRTLLRLAGGKLVPDAFMVALRVVDAPEEAPSGPDGQFLGDFFGLALAREPVDERFLARHGLERATLVRSAESLYEPAVTVLHRGAGAAGDAALESLVAALAAEPKDTACARHLALTAWLPYTAVAFAVRFDEGQAGHQALPSYLVIGRRTDLGDVAREDGAEEFVAAPIIGRTATSWGPTRSGGKDSILVRLTTASAASDPLAARWQDHLRHLVDLLFVESTIGELIDRQAAPLIAIARADRDRWRASPWEAGTEDLGSLEARADEMKRFGFGEWRAATGMRITQGGRAQVIATQAAAGGMGMTIPATPSLVYSGDPARARNALAVTVEHLDTPTAKDPIASFEVRAARIRPPGVPDAPHEPWIHEVVQAWTSGPLELDQPRVALPAEPFEPGLRYRLRVRTTSAAGRTSHWSEPLELEIGAAAPTDGR